MPPPPDPVGGNVRLIVGVGVADGGGVGDSCGVVTAPATPASALIVALGDAAVTGVALLTELAIGVLVDAGAMVAVFVGSDVAVRVGTAVCVFVGATVAVFVGIAVAVLVGAGVVVLVGALVAVFVGAVVAVLVAVFVGADVALAVGVSVVVGAAVAVDSAVGLPDSAVNLAPMPRAVAVVVACAPGVPVAHDVGLADGDAPGCGLADADTGGDIDPAKLVAGDGDAMDDGVGEGVGVSDGVGDGVSVGEGDAVADTLVVANAAAVVVGEGVLVTVAHGAAPASTWPQATGAAVWSCPPAVSASSTMTVFVRSRVPSPGTAWCAVPFARHRSARTSRQPRRTLPRLGRR